MTTAKTLSTLVLAGLLATAAAAAEPVTVDNFTTAESHHYFAARAAAGCFAKLCHERQPRPADQQEVVRLNRDTIYSSGLFDLTTPLTVTLPAPGGRFQSLLVINEQHHNPMIVYGPTTVTLTKENVGSRYVVLAFRTFIDPDSPADIAKAHALQDELVVSQADPGRFEAPEWDKDQLVSLRQKLMALSPFNPAATGRFGKAEEVDKVRHLIGTAAGWGGNPPEAAVYVNRFPPNADGKQAYTLTLKDVPVQAFWSVTIYNEKGYYEAPEKFASVNSVTAKRNKDGSATMHFGGDAAAANYLRIMPNWNYVVRLYRPDQKVIDGSWTVPALEVVK